MVHRFSLPVTQHTNRGLLFLQTLSRAAVGLLIFSSSIAAKRVGIQEGALLLGIALGTWFLLITGNRSRSLRFLIWLQVCAQHLLSGFSKQIMGQIYSPAEMATLYKEAGAAELLQTDFYIHAPLLALSLVFLVVNLLGCGAGGKDSKQKTN